MNLESMTDINLSIIIVNFHAWNKLNDCLKSLLNNEQPEIEFEIIVVDNDPEDPKMTEFAKQFPTVNFIKNSGNHGFAHGCNTGALQSSGNSLLFLNPDTVVLKYTLCEMLKAFQALPKHSILATHKRTPKGKNERVERFFPKLLSQTGPGKALFRLLNKKRIKEAFSSESPMVYPDWVSGSVLMLERETFNLLGGWDTRYWMYSEDADICKRAQAIGGKVALLQSSYIEHHHGSSSRINPYTAALTKTEVKISHHVFISLHFTGFRRILMHSELVLFDTLGTLMWAIISLIGLTHPKAKVKRILLINLMKYYAGVIQRGSWISPRSVGKEMRLN